MTFFARLGLHLGALVPADAEPAACASTGTVERLPRLLPTVPEEA